MDDYSAVNEVYQEFFSEGDYPARTCIAVSALPFSAKVEIEIIASVKQCLWGQRKEIHIVYLINYYIQSQNLL